jgi:hypothetical protein
MKHGFSPLFYLSSLIYVVYACRDEQLLIQGLTLNDEIQRVLKRHDEIAMGAAPPVGGIPATSITRQTNAKQSIPPPSAIGAASAPFSSPFVNASHEDDEPEDDFSFLSRRYIHCPNDSNKKL